MTQGIYIDRAGPASKKAIREAVAANPASVLLESTSLSHGGEFNGPVTKAPPGRYYFTGPDPYTARKFYGQIVVSNDGKITVR